MYLQTTGFDNAYAHDRVGIYLLMRLFEDACADPAIDVIDFGPGDGRLTSASIRTTACPSAISSSSRQRFGARRINATRTAILGLALGARRALDAVNATDRLKALWRKRLRARA